MTREQRSPAWTREAVAAGLRCAQQTLQDGRWTREGRRPWTSRAKAAGLIAGEAKARSLRTCSCRSNTIDGLEWRFRRQRPRPDPVGGGGEGAEGGGNGEGEGGVGEGGRTGRSEEEEGERPRLANMLPELAKWAHSALDTVPNELVDVRIFSPFLHSFFFFLFVYFAILMLIFFLITLERCWVEGDYGTCRDYLFEL